MSNLIRNTVLATALLAATGVSFAARQTATTTFMNPLRVSMLADSSRLQSFMGTVEFKITNNSNEVLKVPYWQLPNASQEGKLFQVLRNGKAVEYLGPMIKRPAPTETDMVTFQPYETKMVSVDLSESYDLSKAGDYTVSFQSFLQGAKTSTGRTLSGSNGRMASLQSVPLKLWVDADGTLRSLKQGAKGQAKPGSTGTVIAGVTYVGCSSTQLSTSNGAPAGMAQARAYSQESMGYLGSHNSGTERYVTWMGAYTSGRYSTVASHFVSIDTAMDQVVGPGVTGVKINCGCRKNYYAYVYPNSPYEIFVCNAFWSAPTAGTDSKGGTLIHEMSHFTVVAGTDDWVYGQTGAKNLAITNPTNAIDNADSHEYFAENNPFQQ